MASLLHNGTDYPDFPNQCIPIMPPGVDPSLADFREFYPYIPNEVKHRKRTTQAQLEILEDMFSRDKKPNGALRSSLARELGMTPRGVQVWFQNRRAKEKTLAKKALAAKRRNQPNINPHIKYDSPRTPEAALQDGDSSPQAHSPEDNKLKSSSAPITAPIQPQAEKCDSAPSSALSPSVHSIHCDMNPDPRTRFLNFDSDRNTIYRRGSLPIITRSPSDDTSYNQRLSPNYDWLERRSSFDLNIDRLASHPFAHLAAQANGTLYGNRGLPPRQCTGVKSNSLPGQTDHLYAQSPNLCGRMAPSHRASMPYVFAQGSISSSNHSAQPVNQAFLDASSRYHHGAYVMPSRAVPNLIPGPLPTPNFSFGESSSSTPAASPCASESPDHITAALSSYSFPAIGDRDIEDDVTNSSFDAFSRFGSIASLADSESSMTSALYSEPGSCASDRHEHPSDFNPDSRRSSHASGQVLDIFSGMCLENRTSPSSASGPYPGRDDMLVNGTSDDMGDSGNADDSPAGTLAYPSPGSTVSGGSNSNNHPGDGRVRISLSSELALALSPSTATEGAAPQDISEAIMDESQVSNGRHPNSRSNDSSPVLDPSTLLGNGRACYDPNYANQSYSVYDDQGNYEFVSKTRQYVVPPYTEGHSSNNLGSSSPSVPSTSPLFPPSDPPPASLTSDANFANYNHARAHLIS